jgi:hypothetical protein
MISPRGLPNGEQCPLPDLVVKTASRFGSGRPQTKPCLTLLHLDISNPLGLILPGLTHPSQFNHSQLQPGLSLDLKRHGNRQSATSLAD